jgi:hypothetical protein
MDLGSARPHLAATTAAIMAALLDLAFPMARAALGRKVSDAVTPT